MWGGKKRREIKKKITNVNIIFSASFISGVSGVIPISPITESLIRHKY